MYSFVWLLWLNITFARFKLFHVPIVHFYYCVAFKVMNILHFTHSTIFKHLVCLNSGAIIHNTAKNILVWTCMYISVWSGMVVSKDMLALSCSKIPTSTFSRWLYQPTFLPAAYESVRKFQSIYVLSYTWNCHSCPFWSCGWVCSDIIFFSFRV